MERALVLLTAAPAATRRAPRAAPRPRGLSGPRPQAAGAEASAVQRQNGSSSQRRLLRNPKSFSFFWRLPGTGTLSSDWPGTRRQTVSAPQPAAPASSAPRSGPGPASQLPLLKTPAQSLRADSRCLALRATSWEFSQFMKTVGKN